MGRKNNLLVYAYNSYRGEVAVDVLCLDLEGVLIPEIWQGVAERTGIEALTKTTRDIPVYEDLMQLRLKVLAEHNISMSLIASLTSSLSTTSARRRRA